MRQNVFIINSQSTDHLDETRQIFSDALHYQVVSIPTIKDMATWMQNMRTPYPDVLVLNIHQEDQTEMLSMIRAFKQMKPELVNTNLIIVYYE